MTLMDHPVMPEQQDTAAYTELAAPSRAAELKAAARKLAAHCAAYRGASISDAVWQVGAAIAGGTIRWMLANAPVFQPKHSFINSLSFYGPEFDATSYIG